MRPWIGLGLLLAGAVSSAAQNPSKASGAKKGTEGTASLQKQLAKADIVVVGKVTRVGLSAASSFDVGAIQVRQVLKGKAKPKTVKFRFAGRGNVPYGK
jgi:hypothetical protein